MASTCGKGGKKGSPPAPQQGQTRGKGKGQVIEREFEVQLDELAIDLGLKCCPRQAKQTKYIYAVYGSCAAWNADREPIDRIVPGDILMAINGVDMTAVDSPEDYFRVHAAPQLWPERPEINTLTIQRKGEVRTMISMSLQGDKIIGTRLSGAEAFIIPAAAASVTVSHLLSVIAKAINARPDVISLFEAGTKMEDHDFPGNVENLVLRQMGKQYQWSYDPAANDKLGEDDELDEAEFAEALPVDYDIASFEHRKSIASKHLSLASAKHCEERLKPEESRDSWVATGDGKFKCVDLERSGPLELERAEALPIDTRPLVKVGFGVRMLGEAYGHLFTRTSALTVCFNDVRKEAAAWLRCSTLAALELPGLEALMLNKEVDSNCAVAANLDLILTLVRAKRWDDVHEYASTILSEEWAESGPEFELQRRRVSRRAEEGAECGTRFAQIRENEEQVTSPASRQKRTEFRRMLGDKPPGFEPPMWPMGRGLPIRREHVFMMVRSSISGLIAAARHGHLAAQRKVHECLQSLDHDQVGTCRFAAVVNVVRALLDVSADNGTLTPETSVPILLKLMTLNSCAHPALQRLANLENLPDIVAPALCKLVVECARRPSKGFCVVLENTDSWVNDPALVAEVQKLDSSVVGLLEHMQVDVVDRCGYPVSKNSSARQQSDWLKVTYQFMGTGRSQDGGWELVAPVVLKLLRRCQSILQHNNELILALCHLAEKKGFTDSRCSALEALTFIAPPGHMDALRVGCTAVSDEDAIVRTQASVLLRSIARPRDAASITMMLKSQRDVYADLQASSLGSILV
jgi:hypothetical protein